MISTVLLVVHIIFVAVMIGLILLQKSEGGALGMGGGNFMSARGTANLLTRSTAVLATLFFLSTLILAVQFKGGKSGEAISSVIEQVEEQESENTTDKPALPDASGNAADTPALPSESESTGNPSSKANS